MYLGHKYCLWVGHIATINPAKGGEGSSLASTASSADKVVTAATSAEVTATTVADKSCARAATANDKAAAQNKVEQVWDLVQTKLSNHWPARTKLNKRNRTGQDWADHVWSTFVPTRGRESDTKMSRVMVDITN